MGESVGGREIEVLRTVKLLLPQSEDKRADDRHYQVDSQRYNCRREVDILCADDSLVSREELGVADNEHDGSILDVDYEVVAYLRDDVAYGLRKNDIEHGLEVVHAYGHCALRLTDVYRHYTAADGLCHICSGVDGDNEICRESRFKVYRTVREVGQGVEDEYRLDYHRRASENFDVDTHYSLDYAEDDPLYDIVFFAARNSLDYSADKADEAAYDCRYNSELYCLERTGQILH